MLSSLVNLSSLTMFLVAAVFLLSALVFLVKKSTRPKDHLKSLPGPTGLPVIGCSHIIGRYEKHADGFSALRKEYGDIYGLTLGSTRCVVVSSMALMKEVLVAKGQDFANRPDFLRFHAIFRGDRNFSIALCDWSDKQRTRRELAYPFMHPRAKSLDSGRMGRYIEYELQELVSELKQVDDKIVDPRPYLLFATANIFYQYLCSKRFSSQDTNFLKTVKIYDLVFRELFKGFAIDFMPWLKIFNQSRLKELKDLAENVSTVTSPLFEEHEQDIDYDNPRDLIDIFLAYLRENEGKNPTALTREDAEVIIDDLIGGHSVLGNLWLWALYILAGNTKVIQSIREEVTRVTADCRAPTLEDKPNMPYTEATTFELLRCIASPIIPHVATRDTTIQDYRVAKDTMVFFNTYDVNMDPELWEDPREFKPERFIAGTGKVTKPDYFLPFGTGKRTCLGDGLVKSTLFLGLSTLVQHFDVGVPGEVMSPPDLYDIPGRVVPKTDIILKFTRVDRTSQSSNNSTTTITMC